MSTYYVPLPTEAPRKLKLNGTHTPNSTSAPAVLVFTSPLRLCRQCEPEEGRRLFVIPEDLKTALDLKTAVWLRRFPPASHISIRCPARKAPVLREPLLLSRQAPCCNCH